MRTPATRRSPARRRALAALALAALAAGCRGAVEPLDACIGDATPELSIFAVGDTGDRPEWIPWLDQFRVVGRVMSEEHARRPGSALLFLGDNFYSEGLEISEAKERIRDNYVTPWCRFIASDGPRYQEVSESCTLGDSERQPVPIYVTLGNHDYNTPDSPKLERELVPQFISNWAVPHDVVDVHELGHGVSAIVVDSEALDRGIDSAPLAEALRDAKGPFRIIVGHHPVSAGPTHFNRALETAMASAGVPVQLLLAGHEHNLQVSEPGPPYPSLVVIAGSGSRLREVRYEVRGRKFLAVKPGFARIDLVGSGESQRLVVSLVQTPKHRIDFWSPTRVAGCFSVTVGGAVSGGANPAAGDGP